MQELQIKTIENHVITELVEKKSRFIANIFHINSKLEAENIIKDIKNKYKDAKHNCFAFSVYENGQKYTKCSDDSEPSGTAGVPILNVINMNELSNVLIVVTRYFGGILLGTGGLTRAYSGAALNSIKESKIIFTQMGVRARVELEYKDSEKFKEYCSLNKINIINIEYNENVSCIIECSDEKNVNLKLEIKEKSQLIGFNIIFHEEICRKFVKKEE